jgi:hypothetical protein
MMAQMRVLMDESDVIVQGAFLASITFLVLYTTWHRWWRSMHGRTLVTIAVAVAAILARSVCVQWHILSPPGLKIDAGDWVATQFSLLLPVTFGAMCWQLVRTHLARNDKPPSSLPAYQVPESWKVYRPTSRVGWALSPDGDWFLVDNRTIISDRREPAAVQQLNAWLRTGALISSDNHMSKGSDESTDSP